MNKSVSPNIVASALAKAHFNKDLVAAAEYHNGKGLEEGLDTNASMALLRIKEIKKSYAYKAAIETVTAAATWPAAGINSIQPNYDPICARCGGEAESDLLAPGTISSKMR